MKFADLGYEWDPESDRPANSEKEGKKRIDYPTLYIRSKDDLPELVPDEEGCVYFMAKARIVGFSERTEGEKTLELEVQAISPKEPPEGAAIQVEAKEEFDDLEVVISKMKKKKQEDSYEDEE